MLLRNTLGSILEEDEDDGEYTNESVTDDGEADPSSGSYLTAADASDDDEADDEVIHSSEVAAGSPAAVQTTPFRKHRTSSSKDFSDDRMNQLILEMQVRFE